MTDGGPAWKPGQRGGAWKQVLAFFVAMGAISHLTSTLVEMGYDAHHATHECAK